mmetsp:Transcript_17516/g.47779  ORF Transcript_17516/g.47779 Transcript_17516/m.47779 type:complete len:257 (-) Transcript_17516:143-913(-)
MVFLWRGLLPQVVCNNQRKRRSSNNSSTCHTPDRSISTWQWTRRKRRLPRCTPSNRRIVNNLRRCRILNTLRIRSSSSSSSRSSSKPMKYQSRLQAHIPSPPQQQPPTRSRNAINQKQTTTPMPKTKEQYRCPRCSSVFGKWDQCCSHVLQCCHLYGVMATKDVCSEAFRLAPDGRPLYSTKQARLLGFDLISCLEDVDGMPTGKNDSIPSGTKEEGTHAGKKPSISHTLRMVQQQTQQLPMHLPCQQPVKVEEVD